MPEAVSTTESIAARVIEESGDTGDTGSNEFAAEANNSAGETGAASGETGAAAPSGAGAGQVAGQPSAENTDELLSELGLKPRIDGREHRIPYSRVQKIRENAIKKAQDAAKGEWEPKLTAAEQRAKAAEDGETAFYQTVMTDPDRAIQVLASVNPAFKEFVRQAQAAAKAGQTQAQNGQAEQFALPEPDYALPDGSRTYTVQGMQKAILDAMEFATTRAEKRISERYKPLEQSHEQQQRAAHVAELRGQSEQRVTKLYADAKEWPGFKENEAAIQKAFNEDFKDLDVSDALNAAYRKIVIPLMQANNAQARERIAAELRGQARSTSLVPAQGQQAPPQTSGARTTEQIARDVAARLAGKAS